MHADLIGTVGALDADRAAARRDDVLVLAIGYANMALLLQFLLREAIDHHAVLHDLDRVQLRRFFPARSGDEEPRTCRAEQERGEKSEETRLLSPVHRMTSTSPVSPSPAEKRSRSPSVIHT